MTRIPLLLAAGWLALAPAPTARAQIAPRERAEPASLHRRVPEPRRRLRRGSRRQVEPRRHVVGHPHPHLHGRVDEGRAGRDCLRRVVLRQGERRIRPDARRQGRRRHDRLGPDGDLGAEARPGPCSWRSERPMFLSKNAKTFEEKRIAVAGYEAIQGGSLLFGTWADELNSGRNADGSVGEGATRAKETGGKAAMLLRMGFKLEKREGVLAAMREAQRPDGGWSQDGHKSDLGTSYRIMLQLHDGREARPRPAPRLHRRAEAVRRRLRPGPGRGGRSRLHVLLLDHALLGPKAGRRAGDHRDDRLYPPVRRPDPHGWEGDTSLWAAKDGKIVGTSTGLNHNEFLATKASYRDFILQLTFRVRGDDSANSGVQFRSVRIPGTEMSGYQADVGQGYWGCLYDESRRNKILVQASDKATAAIHKGEWNHYAIRAMGGKITLYLNGVESVTYTEPDPAIARDGKIALQIHAGKPMTVEFKDIQIQPLPIPEADDKATPGFHLRTVKARRSGEPQVCTVFYLPRDYDAERRPYPAVLFLHGSGEKRDRRHHPGPVRPGRRGPEWPSRRLPRPGGLPPGPRDLARPTPTDAKVALAGPSQGVGKALKSRHEPRRARPACRWAARSSWGIARGRPRAVIGGCADLRASRRRDATAPYKQGAPGLDFVYRREGRVKTVLRQPPRAGPPPIQGAGGNACQSHRIRRNRSRHNSWDSAPSIRDLIDPCSTGNAHAETLAVSRIPLLQGRGTRTTTGCICAPVQPPFESRTIVSGGVATDPCFLLGLGTAEEPAAHLRRAHQGPPSVAPPPWLEAGPGFAGTGRRARRPARSGIGRHMFREGPSAPGRSSIATAGASRSWSETVSRADRRPRRSGRSRGEPIGTRPVHPGCGPHRLWPRRRSGSSSC